MTEDLRMTEKLMMFILDKREKPLKSSSDYAQTVSVIAGILYELLNDNYIIMDDNKKITIHETAEKNTVNYCLEAYEYIANDKKSRKIDDLIVKLLKKAELFKMIENNLLESGSITIVEEKILLFTQNKVKVDETILDNIIGQIRTEFLEDGTLSDDTAFLTFMLYQNNMLKNFFSKYENDRLKKRLKEIKNEPIGKIAKRVMDSYTSSNAAVIATVTTS